MRLTLLRRAVPASVIACVAAIGFAMALPQAAQAQSDDAFRFWGYYQWDDDGWAFAATGPAEQVPADGDVEGWRHAIAGSEPRFPRADGDFDLICGAVEADESQKRVAVVVDFGTIEDAERFGEAVDEPPEARGACAVVPSDANGADVLAAATGEVRYDDSGLTCGIAGYPATGCGGPVEGDAPTGPEEPVELALPAAANNPDPEDDATSDESDDGVPVGLLVGAGAVVVIGGGAAVVARRQRAA